MNQLTMFEGQHEVILLFPDDVNFNFPGDFLILAKNVADALEYSRTEEVTKFCKDGHVMIVKNNQVSASAKNRIRKLNNAGESFISNLSLNRILGKSEKPKAEPFQDWLYEDVLPSVQKKGVYLTSAAIQKTLDDPDYLISIISEYKEEKNKRLLAERQVEELKPRIDYLNVILQSKGTVTITQIGKDYGLTAQELNDILHNLGIQYQVNKQWVLYKKYADKGYTQSYSFPIKHRDGTPDVRMNTQWTQRGRIFIHEELTKLGIKANIEKDYKDVN